MASYVQQPPPPYTAEESKPLARDDDPNRFKVARKPIRKPVPVAPTSSGQSYGSASRDATEIADESSKLNLKDVRPIRKPVPVPSMPSKELYGFTSPNAIDNEAEVLRKLDLNDVPAEQLPRPELSLDTAVPATFTDSQLYSSPVDTRTGRTASSASTFVLSSATSAVPSTIPSSVPSTSSPQSSTSSKVQKAYREARHFAGGLITHPYESTKHYTILRHSHGMVFYKGNATNLAVSIFADAPLPEDRTIWLQSKGWTGKTGMRAKAWLGRHGNWIDVTPTVCVGSDQLNPDNERAWQRDIRHFEKKSKQYLKKNHALRETVIVRIPAEAGDGYFQLVLCIGDRQKVLCPSPTFRLFSTSTSPHSIRGASLRTLPMELGVWALGVHARSTVGAAVAPVTSVIQSDVQSYMPSWWVREAGSATYSLSGASTKVNSTIGDVENRYDTEQSSEFAMVGGEEISIEQGPRAPYPIQFVACYEPGVRSNGTEFNLPTIPLVAVPDIVSPKLLGYYFAWARFVDNKGKPLPEDDSTWNQALVSALPVDIAQLERVSFTKASKKNFSVRLIQHFEPLDQNETKIEIRVMGFVRPDEPSQRLVLEKGLQAGDEAAYEAAMLAEMNDISTAQSVLDHPAWSPELLAQETRGEQQRPNWLEKSKKSYSDTRLAVQRSMDKVPLHKLGVRAPVDMMKDKTIVTNGFYVRRS
jgi:hypothetical protein